MAKLETLEYKADRAIKAGKAKYDCSAPSKNTYVIRRLDEDGVNANKARQEVSKINRGLNAAAEEAWKNRHKNRKKTAHEQLNEMIKEAADEVHRERYLKDIECEQCHYSGPPTNEGCCPECGAICGVAPTELAPKKDPSIQDIERSLGDVDAEYRKDQNDIWTRLYGG